MKSVLSSALRSVVLSLLLLSGSFVVYASAFGSLHQAASQNNLENAFVVQLNLATAPTSEYDYQGHLLKDGDPVAIIEIPAISIKQVVVEGTSSSSLQIGVGHRRDTVLPGQEGMTVLMGKSLTFGAPFAKISELKAGDQVTTYTSQGKSSYSVQRVRYAGEKGLGPVKSGTNQLVLTSSVGGYLGKQRVVRVDAILTSKAFATGVRKTAWGHIEPASRELGVDTSSPWMLSIALLSFAVVFILAAG